MRPGTYASDGTIESITCTTPSISAVSGYVHVSLNGQQFSDSGANLTWDERRDDCGSACRRWGGDRVRLNDSWARLIARSKADRQAAVSRMWRRRLHDVVPVHETRFVVG